jgi:hypothetical protein
MSKLSVYRQYLTKSQVDKLIQEIKYGLMLDDLPSDYHPDSELMVFQQVNKLYEQLYREAGEGCYFCDPTIDANKTEINIDTYLCITCQIKLANFMTACNIDPSKILPLIDKPRKIQRTRFHTAMNMKGGN